MQAKFVVLSFPLGRMPQLGQRMSLYRKGVKTAEVRISGPQMDDNIVADLIEGEAEPGDDVRGS
jgi:hypothetical protein